MMRLFALISFVLSLHVAASENYRHTVNFSGFYGGNTYYLACDYASDRAYELLSKMGATLITTRCHGGFNPIGASIPSLSVSVSYYLDDLGVFSLKSSDSFNHHCPFDTRFIESVVRQNNQLSLKKKSGYCWNAQSRYSYDIEVSSNNSN